MATSTNPLDFAPLDFASTWPDDTDWNAPEWDDVYFELQPAGLPYAWLDLHPVEQVDVLTFLSEAARLALEGKPLPCYGGDSRCANGECLSCNVAWALSKIDPQ